MPSLNTEARIRKSMKHFVLELTERYHEHDTMGQYFIEAESRQMVKYAYHYIQKESGGHSPVWADSKHLIGFDGWHTDIRAIYEITDPADELTLREWLPHWPKP